MVGDYVPFYFCPRSVLLFLIHCANHPDLTYRGGQTPIVHLEADMHEVVAWAERQGRKWAFSLSNAGSYYVEICDRLDQLEEINWAAVAERFSFTRREGRQAGRVSRSWVVSMGNGSENRGVFGRDEDTS
jgi:hypothetical protein